MRSLEPLQKVGARVVFKMLREIMKNESSEFYRFVLQFLKKKKIAYTTPTIT